MKPDQSRSARAPSPFPESSIGPHAARWKTIAGAVATIALSAALAACGGSDSAAPAASASTGAGTDTSASLGTSTAADTPTVNRTLLIDLDGATYSAVQAGIANGSLPNLAKLQVQLAYSGGTQASSQPNLDTPGWATLLSGTWSERSGVSSDTGNQAIEVPTIFDVAKGAGQTGVVAASSGLVQLLAPQKGDGALTTLADCSQNAPTTTCVTGNAIQLIDSGYAAVVAQYHAAEDSANNNFGPGTAQYANTLAQLDAAVGALVAETAKTQGWLVVVTGNHGLGANGQYDALNLLPESTTFVAMNRPANNGTANVNAAVPSTLAGLYAYEGTADIAPTLLSWLNLLPSAASYAMDGGSLVNAQPVSQMAASVTGNGTITPNVVLKWAAPATGDITIYRDGLRIGSLAAGATSYTDNAISQDPNVTGSGSYSLNYVVAGGAAPRGLLQTVQYQRPAQPQTSVLTGLVSYYPFDTLAQLPTPPLDAICTSGSTYPLCLALGGTPTPNTSMGQFQSDISGNVSAVSDPFGGNNALMVDETIADAAGYDGYQLTPSSLTKTSTRIITNDAIGQAIAACAPASATATTCTPASGKTAAFTIGFWYKGACSNTNTVVFGNKTDMGTNATNPYASFGGAGSGGASNGVVFSTWPITSQTNPPVGTNCGFNNNIGDGTTRVDTDSSSTSGVTTLVNTNPYTGSLNYQAFPQNRWVYVAMVVNLGSAAIAEPDGTSVPAYSMSSYVFNPAGTIASSLVQKSYSAKLLKFPLLTGTGTYGIGEDGTGRYHLFTNNSVEPADGYSNTTFTATNYQASLATTNKPTQASVADLGMWNRALSASELQSIFNSTGPLSSLMTPSP